MPAPSGIRDARGPKQKEGGKKRKKKKKKRPVPFLTATERGKGRGKGKKKNPPLFPLIHLPGQAGQQKRKGERKKKNAQAHCPFVAQAAKQKE